MSACVRAWVGAWLTGWRAPARGRCVPRAASARVRGAPDPSAPGPYPPSSPRGADSGTHDDASSPLQRTPTIGSCTRVWGRPQGVGDGLVNQSIM